MMIADSVCLLYCSKQKLGFKRIMLFTNNDNPHPDGQLRVLHSALIVNMLPIVSGCSLTISLDLRVNYILYNMNTYVFFAHPLLL